MRGDEWVSHDKEIAMIAIVLVSVVAIMAVTAFSSTNDMLVVIYTNAITAIGSLATGRAIGRGEK